MNEFIIDFIGWIGAILLIAAYLAVSYKMVAANGRTYQLLNIFGSIFLIVNTAYYRAYPSTVVNIIWLGIGLIVIIQLLAKRSGPESST